MFVKPEVFRTTFLCLVVTSHGSILQHHQLWHQGPNCFFGGHIYEPLTMWLVQKSVAYRLNMYPHFGSALNEPTCRAGRAKIRGLENRLPQIWGFKELVIFLSNLRLLELKLLFPEFEALKEHNLICLPNKIHLNLINTFVMSRNKHISKKTPCFSRKRSKNKAKPNEFERRILKLSCYACSDNPKCWHALACLEMQVARMNFDLTFNDVWLLSSQLGPKPTRPKPSWPKTNSAQNQVGPKPTRPKTKSAQNQVGPKPTRPCPGLRDPSPLFFSFLFSSSFFFFFFHRLYYALGI